MSHAAPASPPVAVSGAAARFVDRTERLAEQPQFLTFHVAGEDYGVGILQVREILEYDTVTRVPGAPPYIRGVINLRGAVVPVLDLAAKLGLEPSPTTKRTCIVIVEVHGGTEENIVGVIADAVNQVVELKGDDIEPPPAFGTHIDVAYLLGMGKAGKKFVLILDSEQLLAAEELSAVHREVEALEGEPGEEDADAPVEAAAEAPQEMQSEAEGEVSADEDRAAPPTGDDEGDA